MHRFALEGILEDERVRLLELDVTDAAMRSKVILEAASRFGGVDVLVNNAGISYRSVVEHMTEVHRMTQMNVNFRSPMELVRLVLPGMRQKGYGRIINVSSVGGMMAMPTMSVYSASKFALEGASEALWYEVRPFGIAVTLIQPGFINSNSFRHTKLTESGEKASKSATLAYHQHYQCMSGFIERLMRRTRATPSSVAKGMLKTLQRKKPSLRVSVTFDAKVFAALRRLLPRRLYHWLLYRSLPGVQGWNEGDTGRSTEGQD